MMTLKQRLPSGVEYVYPIQRVTYEPSGIVDGVQRRTVAITDGNGILEWYTDGTFYVMNDAGATIAKYELGS